MTTQTEMITAFDFSIYSSVHVRDIGVHEMFDVVSHLYWEVGWGCLGTRRLSGHYRHRTRACLIFGVFNVLNENFVVADMLSFCFKYLFEVEGFVSPCRYVVVFSSLIRPYVTLALSTI